ncbi:DUF732 domain-containing protein, partial [Mycolicibacter minnesotensis]|uniref:DUF732 domain-containing protein n=1 Tax=Mycolicibacter minnesotensis TaxID=1118379 RepID=UPI003908AC78
MTTPRPRRCECKIPVLHCAKQRPEWSRDHAQASANGAQPKGEGIYNHEDIVDLANNGWDGPVDAAVALGNQICSDIANGVPESETLQTISDNTTGEPDLQRHRQRCARVRDVADDLGQHHRWCGTEGREDVLRSSG